MPARGIREAKAKTRTLVNRIIGPISERALTEALIIAQGYATLMTPAEYGNLRNSQYYIVKPYKGGLRGRIGYTANYASAVHAAKGTLKGTPRKSGNGNYWDPAGEPQFLSKALDDPYRDVISAHLRRRMKL